MAYYLTVFKPDGLRSTNIIEPTHLYSESKNKTRARCSGVEGNLSISRLSSPCEMSPLFLL